MKFSGKMSLMKILKVTKTRVLTPLQIKRFCKITRGGGGIKLALLPSLFWVKQYKFSNITFLWLSRYFNPIMSLLRYLRQTSLLLLNILPLCYYQDLGRYLVHHVEVVKHEQSQVERVDHSSLKRYDCALNTDFPFDVKVTSHNH